MRRLSLQASTYYYFPESHVRVFARREERAPESVNASVVLFSRLDFAKHSREFKGKNQTKNIFLLSYLPTSHFADMGGGKSKRKKKIFLFLFASRP